MINPFKEINWKPGKTEIRKFGLTILIGFVTISAVITIGRHFGIARFAKFSDATIYLLYTGIIVFALSYLAPKLAKPIYIVWFFVAACIGTVVSNLILMFFFYLLFTPIGIFMRLSGRDPLKLKNAPELSNWDKYQPKTDLKRYYRQY